MEKRVSNITNASIYRRVGAFYGQDAQVIAIDATPDATQDTSGAEQSNTGQPGATGGKKLGCLNAAVEVLKLHPDEALNCKRMIELMGVHGLWQSKAGATPHNTLYLVARVSSV